MSGQPWRHGPGSPRAGDPVCQTPGASISWIRRRETKDGPCRSDAAGALESAVPSLKLSSHKDKGQRPDEPADH